MQRHQYTRRTKRAILFLAVTGLLIGWFPWKGAIVRPFPVWGQWGATAFRQVREPLDGDVFAKIVRNLSNTVVVSNPAPDVQAFFLASYSEIALLALSEDIQIWNGPTEEPSSMLRIFFRDPEGSYLLWGPFEQLRIPSDNNWPSRSEDLLFQWSTELEFSQMAFSIC